MPLKPADAHLSLQEQIIEDEFFGLNIQFEVVCGTSAPYRLRIHDLVRSITREYCFDHSGKEAAAGFSIGDSCRPSWLRVVTD